MYVILLAFVMSWVLYKGLLCLGFCIRVCYDLCWSCLGIVCIGSVILPLEFAVIKIHLNNDLSKPRLSASIVRSAIPTWRALHTSAAIAIAN